MWKKIIGEIHEMLLTHSAVRDIIYIKQMYSGDFESIPEVIDSIWLDVTSFYCISRGIDPYKTQAAASDGR